MIVLNLFVFLHYIVLYYHLMVLWLPLFKLLLSLDYLVATPNEVMLHKFWVIRVKNSVLLFSMWNMVCIWIWTQYAKLHLGLFLAVFNMGAANPSGMMPIQQQQQQQQHGSQSAFGNMTTNAQNLQPGMVGLQNTSQNLPNYAQQRQQNPQWYNNAI